jgi:hypothetical protein
MAKKRSNINRFSPTEPRGLPKRGLATIVDGDCGDRIEYVHILFGTRMI